MLAYTNYSTTDLTSASNAEAVVDVIIDYINLEAGTTIQTFRDVTFPYTGLSSLTLTASQFPVVLAGANLVFRAFKDRGPNTSIGQLSVTSLINDPQYALYTELLKSGIDRLRGRTIQRT